MAGGGSRVSITKGMVNKGIASAALGPIGLFASSKKEQPVTITWTRTPEAAAELQCAEVRQMCRDRSLDPADAVDRLRRMVGLPALNDSQRAYVRQVIRSRRRGQATPTRNR
jgi:hypothetical protein